MSSIESAHPRSDLFLFLRVGMEFQTRGVPMNDPGFTE